MDYFLHIAIMVNIYIILCVSINLVTGLTNLISLGNAAFYGIGAYITALCVIHLNLSLLPSLLFVMLVNGLFALLLAIPTLRLKGDYFILATLAFQYIIYTVIYNWSSVTRGSFGISGISNPKLIAKVAVTDITGFFILSTVLSVLVVYVFYRLIYSPFGRVLRAIRDDETSLASIGRNVFYYKTIAFVSAAAFCGWASYVYATYISYIDPGSFDLDESIFILSALLIGGTGNIRGPVAGAFFVVLLPEVLRFVGLPDAIAAPMRQILYGVTLLIVMFFRKQGIYGENKFV